MRLPAALVSVALVLCGPVAAQELIPSPPLAAGIEALPRLDGRTATARRANSALQALDDLHLGFLICDDGSMENSSRRIEVLADGPDFLSFLIQIGGLCRGAAHPWFELQIVNFDLTSGRQTELADHLPESWIEAGDPVYPLYDLYLAALGQDVTEECRETLADALTERRLRFDLGLDTRTQALAVLPVGLPQVAKGCGNVAGLDPDTLRRAGFGPRLIKAVRGQP